MNKRFAIGLMLFTSLSISSYAAEEQEVEDRVELQTSFIKGNKELPQVLYIVPWQTIKKKKVKPENMVLHSLYGDIFDPVIEPSFQSH